MKNELARRLALGAAGGVLGLGALGLGLSLLQGTPVCPVGGYLTERLGFRGALAAEAAVSALWGMELAAAPLLARWERLPPWGRTLLRYGANVLAFSLWGVTFTVAPGWMPFGVLAGMASGVCLFLWALGWLGSREDAERIRARLGLPEPEGGGGPFQLRPIAPYLLMMAAVEVALPPLLRLVDAPDVPVLTGIAYPLFLPFACFFTGRDVGKRLGVALLFPLACGLLTLPWIFLLYNSSALFQAWLAAGAALLGNLLGAAARRRRERLAARRKDPPQ